MTSDISHYDGLEFWNPTDGARMDRLIGLLELEPGARVLDIGCGKAELLLRIARRYAAHVTGIDRSPHALSLAQAAFAEFSSDQEATFHEMEIKAYEPPPEPFDLIIWIGGPYIGESAAETVKTLATWVRPGGQLLIGDGFWMQPPPVEYLAATGLEAGESTDHAGNIERGEALGLVHLYSCVSSRDEWDLFEGTILFNRERYALKHPQDPDPQGRLKKTRTWNGAQQRWGRDTMGFGFYLFARPGNG